MDTLSLMLDTGTWQEFVDRKKHVFLKIKDGGKIGILSKNDPDAGENFLLVWTVREGQVTVRYQPFRGFRESGADLLFVAEPSALERIYRELKNDPWRSSKGRSEAAEWFSSCREPGMSCLTWVTGNSSMK